MTQKIVQTLQKVSPRSRCVWGALLIAAMVHLLLAVLFRHTPGTSRENVSELPRVGRIVLSDKGNEALARWMKNHDPAEYQKASSIQKARQKTAPPSRSRICVPRTSPLL